MMFSFDRFQDMPEIKEQIVTGPEEVAGCCEYLAGCKRFGFDTEFVGENSYHPHLCLVQVATDEKLFLIDPLTAAPLDAFWKLVVDPANLVVVHAGREEVRLCRLWAGRTPGNLFDLQIAAGLVGLAYPLGHGTLVNQVLSIQMTKGETLTEWRNRPLTQHQIRYAFDDVRYLLPLWQKLHADLERLDRSTWADEEFARLADHAAPEEAAAPEKWRKLRGLGSLDRRRLALVRELFSWREEVAERTNRPARSIVRDDLLIEIARRNPRRERDLHVIRGLPRRDLPAIIDVAERVRALPAENCPDVIEREQDPPQVQMVASVMTAVLNDLCNRWRLAANLVATSADIKLLVRADFQGTPPPVESPLAQGWRGEHVLPELLKVLHGQRSLRITDIRSETPFAFSEASNDHSPGAR
jgi:ribonuclease D